MNIVLELEVNEDFERLHNVIHSALKDKVIEAVDAYMKQFNSKSINKLSKDDFGLITNISKYNIEVSENTFNMEYSPKCIYSILRDISEKTKDYFILAEVPYIKSEIIFLICEVLVSFLIPSDFNIPFIPRHLLQCSNPINPIEEESFYIDGHEYVKINGKFFMKPEFPVFNDNNRFSLINILFIILSCFDKKDSSYIKFCEYTEFYSNTIKFDSTIKIERIE